MESIVNLFPYLVSAWLFMVGIYGVATSRNLIHLTVCLGVVQSSTYVVLLAIGYREGGTAPLFPEAQTVTRAVDPVVQAMVLTDVVVGATVTALLLALALQVHRRTGSLDPEIQRPLHND